MKQTVLDPTVPNRSFRSKLIRGILSLFVIVFCTAMILEIVIRVFHLIPDMGSSPFCSKPGDEDFAPVPNAKSVSLFGVNFQVNSLGLRGPEFTIERQPGLKRVAIVGDSVVWGHGVEERDTFVRKLETLLNKDGRAYEVLNLGVPAYNTYNEKARYERLAPVLKPDITIVVLLYNDLLPKAEHFRITSVGTLSLPDRPSLFPDAWRPALEKSALFHASVRLWRMMEKRDHAYSIKNFPGLEKQLNEIAAIARAQKSTLILTLMPTDWPSLAAYKVYADELARVAAQLNVPFVKFESKLGSPVDRNLFLPSDLTHPNPAGHELMAEVLSKQITGTADPSGNAR